MRVLYDPNSNTAYIALRDEPSMLKSKKLSDTVRVDIGTDGTVYGLLLLNANRQLMHNNRFVLETYNQSSGKKQDFTLEW